MGKNQQMNTVSTLKQLKEVAGLFSCLMEHKVVKTTAQFKWEGPKIPPEEWHKMLAFFQWSYDTTHSETQVRLYVNHRLNTWSVWAYPQEARTGMSAKELEEHRDFQSQRLQFNPDDKWLYFGTVHHHCNAGAFQSGTDERDERDKDGLHITVGNMGSERYTMHERFYLCGQLIPHDLSWFWDIGDAMSTVPDWAAKLLPADIKDQLARGAMIKKAPKDTAFPKQWEDNLIYEKPKPMSLPVHYSGGLGYANQTNQTGMRFQRNVTNLPFDLREARRQFTELCEELRADEMMALQEMKLVVQDEFLFPLTKLIYRNDVSLDKLCEFIEDDIVRDSQASVHEQVRQQIAEGNGIPDHQGSEWDKLPE